MRSRRSHDVERLPFTLRVLLENALRTGTEADVEAVAGWVATAEPSQRGELHAGARPPPGLHGRAGRRRSRRHAATRCRTSAATRRASSPCFRPTSSSTTRCRSTSTRAHGAMCRNTELEFERNRERYAFLRWGQQAFDGLEGRAAGDRHRPPGRTSSSSPASWPTRDGRAFPDTLVGTDSHTTMINGLGVLGWGVGGIEAEAAMLGESVSMLVPQVVGFRLTRRPPRRRDGDRPRADGDADPPRDRRRREVRRVLRRRPRRPAGRRPRDAREHVARVRRDLRLLPGRRGDARRTCG